MERTSLEEPEPGKKEPRHGILGFLGEVPGLVLMAFVLALIIRTFLFQAFFIPSPSMEPTLVNVDRVLVNKIPYYFHDPRRGDIIVFENPNPGAAVDPLPRESVGPRHNDAARRRYDRSRAVVEWLEPAGK